MYDLYTTLKNLCDNRGITLAKMCSDLGMSKSTTTELKKGRAKTLSSKKVEKIAEYFGVSVDFILGRDNEQPNNLFEQYGLMPIERKKIPMLGEIACGQPIFANEERESYTEVGTEIDADFCLRAKGDSMINARILDGDIVFIRKQPIVNNGEIAVVIIGDEATLKRVYYYPETEKLILNPENPKYEPLVYVGAELEQIRILGKAIAFQSDVR